MEPLRTRPDFREKVLEPFDQATLDEIRRVTATLRPGDLELHEARRFGRFVIHDHPDFTALQRRAVSMVSAQVGERLEVSYNFLSLYSARGVCAVHLDAPEAKWTLDLCVDQSAPWPIFMSDVQPWPEAREGTGLDEADWQERIKGSPSVRFREHVLQPGQALVFSGSSQWHYRDPMPAASGRSFCTQLFLHFFPEGTGELIAPENWARLFGIPELAAVTGDGRRGQIGTPAQPD
jgi:hypothetical protein